MRYYHVWVRSEQYRGSEALTYSHDSALDVGAVVTVPLRTQQVAGFVVSEVGRPSFKVKPISSVTTLPNLPKSSLALAAWLRQYYASPIGVITAVFLPPKLPREQAPAPVSIQPNTPRKFDVSWTPEQAQALKQINHPDTYLLHGRTGSGKTHLYIELAGRSLKSGRSVIVLSPEIGLTSQLASEFRKVFGNRVLVLHSQLTSKERLAIWQQVLYSSIPLIIIGPRSALFSPLRDIGLIVVDESHDGAYKQEQPPYYQAVRVASQLRHIHDATLILGSATPSVGDYYMASARQKPILRLSQLARPNKDIHRTVHIVDLKDRGQFNRSLHLSQALIESIQTGLAKGEQALLYLNRRGTARITLCDVCGWQARCPNCDLPLAYHGDTFKLRCHTCGYSQAPTLACPVCGNSSVVLKSFGTKAIAEEAERLFPAARVARFDTDTSKSERLEHQYEAVKNGDVDILVGTQMLGKGLDLPHLSTLGIVLADSSLYIPDYTARERTYQLLTQVIGRVGRGHIDSQVFIQTYYPGSQLVQAAIDGDWPTFYEPEIDERKRYGFPPFRQLLKISCRRASERSAERACQTLKQKLEDNIRSIEVDGPAPAFRVKAGGTYQWQLVVKSSSRQPLLDALALLPSGWTYDLDPSDLL